MSYENITVNTQSSIRIAASSKIVYFDPIEIKDGRHDADIIFVTHDHFDHYSPETILNLKKDTTILVVPEKLYSRAVTDTNIPESNIISVKPGMEYDIDGMSVKTVHAYNNLKPFHPKGNGWCGYIIEADNIKYYIAGDTDANSDNKNVICDVALVPVGGTYTMNSKDAAKFVNTIKPAAAIPTHYGSIVGKAEDGKIFASLVDNNTEVIFKL